MKNFKIKFLNFISNPKYIFGIYLIVAILSAISKFGKGDHNNFLVFKNVFWNMVHQSNLYAEYPEKHFDTNFYGPLYSIIIAPFAILPDYLGMILWNLALVTLYIFSIKQLPLSEQYKSFFAWLTLQELITSLVSFQFNIAIASLIILSFCFIFKRKESLSALTILIGTFVKLYGIVGLSGFFFIKNKRKFIVSFIILFFVLLFLPSILGGVKFNLNSYSDWYSAILFKNSKNQGVAGDMQNISFLGMMSRIFGLVGYNAYMILLGIFLFMLPYIRIKQYQHIAFQLLILSSTLIFTVLFSSSSESSTYIVAVSGVVLWFLIQKEKTPLKIGLLIFVIILTCFSTSDLFPKEFKRNYIVKYSLKALPVTILWFRILYELLVKDFSNNKHYLWSND